MIYAVLADATLALHLAFIVFIVLGGLALLWRRRVIWIHLPAAAWGVAIELFGWTCPLTPLENWLRMRAGEQGYSGTFVEQYLLPIIYPAGLTRSVQLGLAALVLVANLAIYALVWRRSRSR